MLVIGLSGTVASGKNFVADIFKDFGADVFDADQVVSEILEKDQLAIAEIDKSFDGVVSSGKIDRKKLAQLVFSGKSKLDILEKIIHPKVAKVRKNFILQAKKAKKALIILNIPLLFEKNIYKECDYNILVKSDYSLQKERFIKRELSRNIDSSAAELSEKFDKILQNQSKNEQKEALADFILQNNQGQDILKQDIKNIVNKLIKIND